MNTTPPPISPRRRLQDLLAIPERQRTDEEWDEINELEIKLASANREDAPDPNIRRNQPAAKNPGGPGNNNNNNNNHARRNRPGGGGGGQQQGKKPPRKFHKKPGSGSGSGSGSSGSGSSGSGSGSNGQ